MTLSKIAAFFLLALPGSFALPAFSLPPSLQGISGSPGDELFTNASVPHLKISITAANMQLLRNYQWQWGGNSWARTNVPALVREGNHVYTNVAVHLKGGAGSFRPVDDHPALTLNFAKFARGQTFHGLEKIHLNNSQQDPTFLCERIARELFLEAGVPTTRASHAVVLLNGRPLGLYVLVEGWNKQFLRRHFSDVTGNLYDGGFARDIDQPLEVNSGDFEEDHHALRSLLEACQNPDPAARGARLTQILDVDRFLTFAALEVLLCHWDGYAIGRNNYRIFHDRSADRLVFMPHGLDQLFGTWQSTPESSITPPLKSIVGRAVLQMPTGRQRYLDRISTLLTNVFVIERLLRRVDELSAVIRPHLGQIPLQQHVQLVAGLKDRIQRRTRSAAVQLQRINQPLVFDRRGEAKLSGWQPKRDSGNPRFTRNDGAPPGLEVAAGGVPSAGSWRTSVLLDAGQYRLEGRVKTVALEAGGISRGGVSLRISGDRNARMTPSAPAWSVVAYEFTLLGLTDVEVVCEFRATNGSASFDLNSLKLVRSATNGAPSAPR